MRRVLLMSGIALIAVAAISGCTKKTDTASTLMQLFMGVKIHGAAAHLRMQIAPLIFQNLKQDMIFAIAELDLADPRKLLARSIL